MLLFDGEISFGNMKQREQKKEITQPPISKKQLTNIRFFGFLIDKNEFLWVLMNKVQG